MKEKQIDTYTDASLRNNNFGIGVLFIKPYDSEKRINYKTNMKSLINEFNEECHVKSPSYIVEAYAILKALQNIYNKYDKINIYTDNAQCFDMFNDISKRKEKYKLFNKIVDKCKLLMKDKNVEIRWIRSHCGVYGNEIADTLAKKARKNDTQPICNNTLSLKLLNFNFFNSFKLDNYILDTTIGKKYRSFI